jgi:N-acyl-D-amino-acid deacylase
MRRSLHLLPLALLLAAAPPRADANGPAAAAEYDLVVRGGTIYNGLGGEPYTGDVAVQGDRIAAVGPLPAGAKGKLEVDARGLAVAPGFINMLSWATESLLVDGRGQSDIRQGVTLEVMGEGGSMGPLNAAMKKEGLEQQGDLKYEIAWTTLGEYLEHLEKRGVSPNVASFVGATTVRVHELAYADRPPTAEELARMQELVRRAMEEGALGVGSSLIYAPAFYASTDELVALAEVAGRHGGMYISHMRSEANRLLEALDELIAIARRAKVPAEIYHLKAAGKPNWGKLDDVIEKVEAARAEGLAITADMYTYTAGATGLDAAMPPWVQEGGLQAWIGRLKDPATRERVAREMAAPTDAWENFYVAAGPEQMLLVSFRNEALKPLTGKTLAEVAKLRGKSPQETAMDLVIEDDSRVGTVYFLMSEENVRRQIATLPWLSFGSDEAAPTNEGVFLKSRNHPRAYGNFARLLGRYVRDEKLLPLEEAIRRLTSLPATNLKLRDRGVLAPGFFADLVVFDPAKIQDHATFEDPHRYATGVRDVWVNGMAVLRGGEHTGATPGRVVRGPGWTGWKAVEEGLLADPDALIGHARRAAYMGRYEQAIDLYTRGAERHPRDPRFLRHRGHRYITLRRFADAEADLARAAVLAETRPIEVEPDGLPNPRNVPTSTLQDNIWYHLGLARYLQGDFAGAQSAFRSGLGVATNDDMRVATTYWLWNTSRRLGFEDDARALLVPIRADLPVVENHAYHRLLLLFKGEATPDALLAEARQGGELDGATVGYGVGNWHFVHGRREEAARIWREVVAGGPRAAFGFIAAEAELVRLAEGKAR